jgi:hypothetical protein
MLLLHPDDGVGNLYRIERGDDDVSIFLGKNR